MNTLLEPKLKDFARFFDKKDKIRLLQVRNEACNRLITHEELQQIYADWVHQDEYLVLAKPESRKFVAVKCSKRGNDVYKFRIENRFKELDALAEIIGNDIIFDINQQDPKTNVLFVTFTYDTKRCSESKAWEQIGIEFNRAVSNIKRKFGNCSILRAWEGHKNGYPHIHAIMVHDEMFDVFEHQKTANTTEYRIQQKQEFDSTWHSWIDVKAVSSIGGAIRYLTKYLRKTYGYDAETNLTQAQMWINRKQSFSMSHDFLNSLRLVYENLHNSNKKTEQLDLFDESTEEKWQLVGIYSKEEIKHLVKDDSTSWNLELSSLDGLKIGEKKKKWLPDRIWMIDYD